MTHPREDRTIARTSRQSPGAHVAPLQLRLVGPDTSVIAALDVIGQVFDLTDQSDLFPGRNGRVRVYATITRRVPYSGGIK